MLKTTFLPSRVYMIGFNQPKVVDVTQFTWNILIFWLSTTTATLEGVESRNELKGTFGTKVVEKRMERRERWQNSTSYDVLMFWHAMRGCEQIVYLSFLFLTLLSIRLLHHGARIPRHHVFFKIILEICFYKMNNVPLEYCSLCHIGLASGNLWACKWLGISKSVFKF